MRCLVTGAAGFIGSHLAEKLVSLGHDVVGVDCFADFYPKEIKVSNIRSVARNKSFALVEANLLEIDLHKLLAGVDCIYHQAAQPGVRESWGKNFEVYTANNVLVTQRLLEVGKNSTLRKFVYASSSSVYGDVDAFPISEDVTPKPVSPYGVSKLAGEHLCHLYWKNYGAPVVSLRYFTVYGPRQRPDMAFNKFIKAILTDGDIIVYGDGTQTRDFTYISDAVDANITLLNTEDTDGQVFNIGGGSRVSINNAISILEEITMKKASVRYVQTQKGDVKHTFADTGKAEKVLGYEPKVDIREGLRREIEWLGEHL